MKKAQTVIAYAGGILLAVIGFMVVCLDGAIDYFWDRTLLLPNPALLPIGLVVFVLCCLLGRWIAGHALKKGRSEKRIFCGVLLSGIAGFILLGCLTYQYYFRTGWDADALFIGSMRLMSGGDLTSIENYLAQYPNNILLVLIQSFVLKVNVILHIFPEMDGLFSLVVVQCGIVAMTGVLFYDMMKRLTHSVETAMMGYAVYWLFFLTSPWTAIPYSDTLGLFVPVLVTELVLLDLSKPWQRILRAGVIGAGSYLAFQLKPQLLILTIAAVLVGLTKLLTKDILPVIKRHAAAGMSFLLAFLLFAFAVPRAERLFVPMTFYDNANMIPTHYIMMGLNTERDGAYLYEDVEISQNQPNKEARKAENLRVIRERLRGMGAAGLSAHLVRKAMSCYDDGTFFWGREGNFYQQVPEEKNSFLSPLLREIFYNSGSLYPYFSLFRQAIWIAALVLAAVGALSVRRADADRFGIAVIFLSIIGLTMFELLFEARSRYLYSYVPIYLAAAVLGIRVLADRIKQGK